MILLLNENIISIIILFLKFTVCVFSDASFGCLYCNNILFRLLSTLSQLQRPKRILELGTFTGYSALCLAEGLTTGGSWYDGASLVAIDKDRVTAEVAKSFFDKREEECGGREVSKLLISLHHARHCHVFK